MCFCLSAPKTGPVVHRQRWKGWIWSQPDPGSNPSSATYWLADLGPAPLTFSVSFSVDLNTETCLVQYVTLRAGPALVMSLVINEVLSVTNDLASNVIYMLL